MTAEPIPPELLYATTPNRSLLQFAGGIAGSVLDVGCGAGAWVQELRRSGASEVVGVDSSELACRAARPHYDLVVHGRIEDLDLSDLGRAAFETIVAADVLEHLVDPWGVLRRLASWSSPSGRLLVSVPNLRYYRLLRALVVDGDFQYSDSGGLMDRSHLRWFTRRSLGRVLLASGWRPDRWGGSWGAKRRRTSALTGGLFQEFLQHQIYASAILDVAPPY